MSPKYPVLNPQEIIRALKKVGFRKVSQRGSHLKLKKEEPVRIVIIPMHEEVARGATKKYSGTGWDKSGRVFKTLVGS